MGGDTLLRWDTCCLAIIPMVVDRFGTAAPWWDGVSFVLIKQCLSTVLITVAMSPFDPACSAADFVRWADCKRAALPADSEACVVEITDWQAPCAVAVARIQRLCRAVNFAVVSAPPPGDRESLLALSRALGLVTLDRHLCADPDGVAALQAAPAAPGDRRGDYIPYSNKALNWHSDGYYAPPAAPVRAFGLLCLRPAEQGGGNALLDPEWVYLRLRERRPAVLPGLFAPDALALPPNPALRGARSGAVFRVDAGGDLLTRYTVRQRHVQWSAAARPGVAAISELIARQHVPIFRVRLAAGQALVCNNVWHMRQAFTDRDHTSGRLMLRARFRERIANTGVNTLLAAT